MPGAMGEEEVSSSVKLRFRLRKGMGDFLGKRLSEKPWRDAWLQPREGSPRRLDPGRVGITGQAGREAARGAWTISSLP